MCSINAVAMHWFSNSYGIDRKALGYLLQVCRNGVYIDCLSRRADVDVVFSSKSVPHRWKSCGALPVHSESHRLFKRRDPVSVEF